MASVETGMQVHLWANMPHFFFCSQECIDAIEVEATLMAEQYMHVLRYSERKKMTIRLFCKGGYEEVSCIDLHRYFFNLALERKAGAG